MSNPKSDHNQPLTDPIAHFKSIPWCAKLLSDKSIVSVQIPDRTPIASTESAFVRETLNTPKTVKACVVMLKYIKPTEESKKNGDSKERPFIEVTALVDLQSGVNGYAKTAHGGIFGVVLDEVMGTAANMQSDYGAYTVNLNVSYKKTLITPAVVVVRGRVAKKDGRKLQMKGSFEDENGEKIAEAEGLWIMMGKNVGRSNIGRGVSRRSYRRHREASTIKPKRTRYRW